MYEFNNETVTIENLSYDYLFKSESRQFGWQFLISLSKTIIPSFSFFKGLHALLINVSVGFFIYNFFKLKFMSLLCYYIYMYPTLNFEILREALAVSIFLLSIQFLIKKNYVKYYIMVGIAFSFHMSAIILILIPFLSYISRKKNIVLIILLICLLSLFFSTRVQYIFYHLVFIDSIVDKAIYYFSSDQYEASKISFSNLVNYVINIILPILLVLKAKDDKYINTFTPFIIAYAVIYTMSLSISIFYRFNNYFNIFYIFAYLEIFNSKYLFSKLSTNARRLVLCCGVGIFCILKLNVIMIPLNNIPGYYRYYPYSSIFDKEINQNRERIYNYVN